MLREPISCSAYNLGDRIILMFGEEHGIDRYTPGLPVSDLVASLCESGGIDVFIERWNSFPAINCGLRSLCIQISNIPNIRIHRCDARKAVYLLDGQARIVADRINSILLGQSTDDPIINDFLNNSDSPFWFKKIIPIWWHSLKINRQIANIRSKVIRQALYKFIRGEIDKNVHILRLHQRRNARPDIVRARLCSLFSIVMDAYMLGRMLRHFRDGARPERIIVYTGDGHYERIVRFFRIMRFVRIHTSLPGLPVRNPFKIRKSLLYKFTHSEKPYHVNLWIVLFLCFILLDHYNKMI